MSSEQDKNVVKGLFEWSQDSHAITTYGTCIILFT